MQTLALAGVLAGATPDKVVTTSWRSFDLWSSPEVYAMIMKAAHDGAQAILASPEGPSMRTVSNIMARIDVVLGAVWEADGQITLWPMVNEMDWFNSAGMLSSFWVGDQPAGEGTPLDKGEEAFVPRDGSADARDREAVMQSRGFKVEQALYEEVLRTYTEHTARMQR